MTSIASTPTAGLRSAICRSAIARSAASFPRPDTAAYWRVFNDRVFELWQKYDAIAKEKKPDSFFFANLGGNVRGGPNLDRLGKIAAWFQADNQGRTYDDPAVWGCSLQGRVCNAVLDGKFAANVTAAYSTGAVRWRNASKNPAEAKMWLNETVASGMALYYHFIGSETGFGEDRRWQKVGTDYFQLGRRNTMLTSRLAAPSPTSAWSWDRARSFSIPVPLRAHAHDYMRETTQGSIERCSTAASPSTSSTKTASIPNASASIVRCLLPNIAMLSDRQCQQIRDYVRSGGSIMASFETGLYDENMQAASEFGLADLLGISKSGDAIGTNGNAYYSRIERQHPDPHRLRRHQLASWRTKPPAR